MVSEYGTLSIDSGPEMGGQRRLTMPFALLFQNMQLFPDTVGDVFSDEMAEALRGAIAVLTPVAVGGAIAGASVLLGPVGAVAGVIAAIFGGAELAHRKINVFDLGQTALSIPLYKGAGRKEQLDGLIELLNSCPDQVVGLAEMWVPDEARAVMEAVKVRFPHQLYGPHNDPDVLTGGLLLLSREPITAADSLTFRSSTGEDALSSKGVLWARIDDEVDVYITHFQSDNPEINALSFPSGRSVPQHQQVQAMTVREFIEATRNPGCRRFCSATSIWISLVVHSSTPTKSMHGPTRWRSSSSRSESLRTSSTRTPTSLSLDVTFHPPTTSAARRLLRPTTLGFTSILNLAAAVDPTRHGIPFEACRTANRSTTSSTRPAPLAADECRRSNA